MLSVFSINWKNFEHRICLRRFDFNILNHPAIVLTEFKKKVWGLKADQFKKLGDSCCSWLRTLIIAMTTVATTIKQRTQAAFATGFIVNQPWSPNSQCFPKFSLLTPKIKFPYWSGTPPSYCLFFWLRILLAYDFDVCLIEWRSTNCVT